MTGKMPVPLILTKYGTEFGERSAKLRGQTLPLHSLTAESERNALLASRRPQALDYTDHFLLGLILHPAALQEAGEV